MKYFSTFSGVGGFELGIQYADISKAKRSQQRRFQKNSAVNNSERLASKQFTCVGFSEVDKYASAVLKYQFPNIKNYGDIKKIDWSTVPDFDLLVGGSPCQDLSVAGKQKGLTGERSGLFHEYIRALKEKQPDHFIWENVKGSLSSNEGRDFAEIINAFSEAGYSLWWQVLNAKDFGVPQNRERVFIVGSRTTSPREISFERTADKNTVVSNTIRTGGKGSLSKKHAWDLVSIPVLTPDRINKRQNGRRFKTDGEEMFTLNTQDKHGVFDGREIRRITPRECERLMSWPDNWTKYGIINGKKKEMSDSQRYKMCGNGVVSEVVRQVVEQHFL